MRILFRSHHEENYNKHAFLLRWQPTRPSRQKWSCLNLSNFAKFSDHHHLIIKKILQPLANALHSHWHGTYVDIISRVVSRACTPNILARINITLLINPIIDPQSIPSQTPNPRRYPYHLLPTHTLCPMATPHAPPQILPHRS
jgi:hypothetical protein